MKPAVESALQAAAERAGAREPGLPDRLVAKALQLMADKAIAEAHTLLMQQDAEQRLLDAQVAEAQADAALDAAYRETAAYKSWRAEEDAVELTRRAAAMTRAGLTAAEIERALEKSGAELMEARKVSAARQAMLVERGYPADFNVAPPMTDNAPKWVRNAVEQQAQRVRSLLSRLS